MVKLLIYLLLIVFPFGQLTKINLGNPQIGLYLHDLIILLIIFFWLLEKFKSKQKISMANLGHPLIAFILVSFFSWFLVASYHPWQEILIALLYCLRLLLYLGLYFVVQDQFKITNWTQSLIFVGLISAVFGLLQYFVYPDLRPLTVYDWDPHYFRVVGTFLDPQFTGLIYVFTLILIACQLWQNKKNHKLIYFLCLILVYFALALTYSRSSWLAYLTAMAVIAWKKHSCRFISSVVIIGLVTVLILPRPGGEGVKLERQSTIWARINNWKQSLTIFWDQPLFGVGFNYYRFSQRDYGFLGENWQKTHSGAGADSSLLFVLATTGVVGIISLLRIFVRFRLLAMKNVIVLATGTALLVHSFFNNSLFYPWIMIWMIMVIGNIELLDG